MALGSLAPALPQPMGPTVQSPYAVLAPSRSGALLLAKARSPEASALPLVLRNEKQASPSISNSSDD